MDEPIVINTGPLITLARIEALHIPAKLPYAFVCPQQVREEMDAGEKAGHERIAPEWLKVVPLEKEIPLLESSTLGPGEAAVIELALAKGIRRVCIDEWKGRRAASTAGLKLTGVLGLLGRAKKLGIIPEVRPYVDRALAAGIRYDESLIRNVLEAIGESCP